MVPEELSDVIQTRFVRLTQRQDIDVRRLRVVADHADIHVAKTIDATAHDATVQIRIPHQRLRHGLDQYVRCGNEDFRRLIASLHKCQQLLGGDIRFYERKEVKDLLAYLKLAVNPADDVAFRRVINTPARGIGATSLQTIADVARAHGISMMQAAEVVADQALIAPRAAGSLRSFLSLIDELSRRAAED